MVLRVCAVRLALRTGCESRMLCCLNRRRWHMWLENYNMGNVA